MNFQIGPLNLNYGAGIAIDGQGNIGTYLVAGGGAGAGANASAGLTLGGSNGQTICDLGGPFGNISVGGGVGPAGSLDVFQGPSDHGLVTGGGVTFGAGVGGEGSIGATNTVVTPMGHLW